MVRDGQARANGYFVPLHHDLDTSGDQPVVVAGGSGDPIETVAVPLKIHGIDIAPGGPVPSVGANSDEVLVELGFDEEEISSLRADGVVA